MTPCEKCGATEVKRRIVPTDGDARERVTVVCAKCGHERAVYERDKKGPEDERP
jgi:DNA-directed RNA polymerase subunit M/transcription elongation factor TFIIS